MLGLNADRWGAGVAHVLNEGDTVRLPDGHALPGATAVDT